MTNPILPSGVQKRELSKIDYLNQNTTAKNITTWTDNFRDNLTTIQQSQRLEDLPKIAGPALIVGGGPSLEIHLDHVAAFKGTIFACEKSLKPLLEHGVIPNYLVALDGTTLLVKYISDALVDQHSAKIKGLFATTVSPVLVRRWFGPLVFFNAWVDDPASEKSVSMIFTRISKRSCIQTGGHVGGCMWFIARELGANPLVLVGVDMAYPGDIPDLSATQIWPAISRLPQDAILQLYKRVTNPFGRSVITDYMFDGLYEAWVPWIEATAAKTIQCSDFTAATEPPMFFQRFEDYLQNQRA